LSRPFSARKIKDRYCSTLPNLGATDRIGFSLNIIVIGAVDTGYVMLLIVPGYLPASFVALAGPIVYVIGAMFSTAGLLRRDLGVSSNRF